MADEIVNLNFDGVEASDKAYTRPGTIGIFKITDLSIGKSKTKQTPGMTVKFENEDSQFSHTFYLQASTPEKTKKLLGRVQALYSYIYGEGNKLSGGINNAILTAKFKGKELALKVSGEVSSNGKGFATLSYSGFGRPVAEKDFLRFTAEEENAVSAALQAIEASRSSSNADGEQSSGGGSEEQFANAGAGSEATENF